MVQTFRMKFGLYLKFGRYIEAEFVRTCDRTSKHWLHLMGRWRNSPLINVTNTMATSSVEKQSPAKVRSSSPTAY